MLSGEITSVGRSLSCKIVVPISWDSCSTFLASNWDMRASNLGSFCNGQFAFVELTSVSLAWTTKAPAIIQWQTSTNLMAFILPKNESNKTVLCELFNTSPWLLFSIEWKKRILHNKQNFWFHQTDGNSVLRKFLFEVTTDNSSKIQNEQWPEMR